MRLGLPRRPVAARGTSSRRSNGGRRPGVDETSRRATASRRTPPRPPRLVERRIERPEGRPGARQADRPAEEPQSAPGGTATSPGDDGRGGRQQVVGRGEDAGPLQQVGGASGRSRTRSAKCSEAPGRRRRPASAPRRTPRTRPGVETATAGVTSSDAGRARRRVAQPASGVTRSPRPSTSAGPPARKNGTSEPIEAASAGRVVGVEDVGRAPGLERAVDRRGGVADCPPREPGRDRDPLVQAGRERRAAPVAGARPTARRARRRSRAGRGCRRRARDRSPSTWRLSVAAAGDATARGSAGRRGRAGPSPSAGRGSRRPVGRRPRASG